jgi:glycerophosphoryl diester phosphodiesterase
VAQIILHDAEVDRTTDGCGTVWDLTLAEVKALRVVRTIPNAGRDTQASHTTAEALATAGDVTEEQIPTFEELLDSLPSGLELNVHTYPGPNDHETTVAGVVSELQRRGLLETAFVAGTSEVLATAIALEPRIRRCLLSFTSDDDYVKQCAAFDCDIIQPNWSIVDKALCDEAHSHGMRVDPFWADEVPEMERMLDDGAHRPTLLIVHRLFSVPSRDADYMCAAGVDGLLTNYAGVLIDLLSQRGMTRPPPLPIAMTPSSSPDAKL